jgi:hypothetical protein
LLCRHRLGRRIRRLRVAYHGYSFRTILWQSSQRLSGNFCPRSGTAPQIRQTQPLSRQMFAHALSLSPSASIGTPFSGLAFVMDWPCTGIRKKAKAWNRSALCQFQVSISVVFLSQIYILPQPSPLGDSYAIRTRSFGTLPHTVALDLWPQICAPLVLVKGAV